MGPQTRAASLPNPDATDPSDVAVALEAARALWNNEDTGEALRWLSRAAEAAEQEGNDRRALDLARAVADLKDALAADARATPPPPGSGSVVPPVTRSVTPPPLPPARPSSSLPAPPASRVPPASMRPSPSQAAPAPSAPTPPSMRPRPPEPPKPPSPGSRPPSPISASAPTPPSMRPRPPEPAKSAPPPPSMRPRPPEPARAAPTPGPPAVSTRPPEPWKSAPGSPATPLPSAKGPSEPVSLAPPSTVEKAVAPTAPAAKRTAEGLAQEPLRVSVKSSVREPDLFLVRILRKGQAVPPSCHEAFLSPAEHGVDLRRLRD
jgi:hypothetical protein